jgi:hypothetical protein
VRNALIDELKTAITVYINISQPDLQKVFAQKMKLVQACTDARRHHFQHILLSARRLSEHFISDSNTIMEQWNKVVPNETYAAAFIFFNE